MAKKHTPTKARIRSLHTHLTIVSMGILSVVSSFALGIKTAGDVETIAPSEAQGTRMSGDMTGDNRVTIEDAVRILEIAQGYDEATPEELLADPNQDGRLTVDDAVRILHDIASRS